MIISTKFVQDRLVNADDENDNVAIAAAQATSFVNANARNYYPFSDFDSDNNVTTAPDEIVSICLNVARAKYGLLTSSNSSDDDEQAQWLLKLAGYKTELRTLTLEPVWKSVAISLNSDDAMLIADWVAPGGYPQVIPHNATVTSGTSNKWVICQDFTITKGYAYNSEQPEAWYLRALNTSLEGALNYMQTYRNDTVDYMRYGR